MKQSLRKDTTSRSCFNIRQILFAFLFLALTLSLFACTKRPRQRGSARQTVAGTETTRPKASDQQSAPLPATTAKQQASLRTNINSASTKELEQLPGIGEGFAARIIEHRERYGPFRRPEHLITVRGISDRKFRALRDLITVD